MIRNAAALLVTLAAASLAACAGDREELAYVERPVEPIYLAAYDELQDGNYPLAVALFDEVERQHPYSEWARRAMLMAAYANYADNEYDAAIDKAQSFLSLHPGNEAAPYAYYLIAQSHFERITDVGRDQSSTLQALEAWRQVVRRYPDSDYARDARLKVDMSLDQLAGKEMDVGRWYLRNGHTLAAIGRFKTVIDNYQTTSHAEEALHRLVEAYVQLGVVDEATQVASVLGHNYPGGRWYEDSYGLLQNVGAQPAGEEPPPSGFLGRTIGRIF